MVLSLMTDLQSKEQGENLELLMNQPSFAAWGVSQMVVHDVDKLYTWKMEEYKEQMSMMQLNHKSKSTNK